jgi:hypothetical protein
MEVPPLAQAASARVARVVRAGTPEAVEAAAVGMAAVAVEATMTTAAPTAAVEVEALHMPLAPTLKTSSTKSG